MNLGGKRQGRQLIFAKRIDDCCTLSCIVFMILLLFAFFTGEETMAWKSTKPWSWSDRCTCRMGIWSGSHWLQRPGSSHYTWMSLGYLGTQKSMNVSGSVGPALPLPRCFCYCCGFIEWGPWAQARAWALRTGSLNEQRKAGFCRSEGVPRVLPPFFSPLSMQQSDKIKGHWP